MRICFAIFCLAAAAAIASAQAADSRLTPAEVEAIAKVAVHQVGPAALPGAGPGLNFVTLDNQLLLMVNFGTDALYARAKAQKEKAVGGMTVPMVLFHGALPGIGDEAFDSPPGPVQYVIYLRKGTKAASVTTYLEKGTKPRLTMDQLKAIAKLIAARL